MDTRLLCDCCASVLGHIRQHYDPDGLTRASEDPAEVLALFRACGADECDLTLEDVEEYVGSCE